MRHITIKSVSEGTVGWSLIHRPLIVDAVQVIRVLTNLLSNAIKFSLPYDTITIEVDACSSKEDKLKLHRLFHRSRAVNVTQSEDLLITIRDNGIGLSKVIFYFYCDFLVLIVFRLY